MGLDPTDDSYIAGVQCIACKDVIFDSITPKYIEADFKNIAACPGILLPPPNEVFLLTQTIAPCVYSVFPDPVRVTLLFEPTGARLIVSEVVAGDTWAWYVGFTGVPCETSFPNIRGCGVFQTLGFGGSGQLFWGPEVEP